MLLVDGWRQHNHLAGAARRRALLDRYMLPRGIDVLTTVMEEGAEVDLQEWFGPEVTGRPEYETSTLAVQSLPALEGNYQEFCVWPVGCR
jgi:hypothetical protein